MAHRRRLTARTIRDLREQYHLSQKALAERIPTTIRTISRWESGPVRPSPMAQARIEAIRDELDAEFAAVAAVAAGDADVEAP